MISQTARVRIATIMACALAASDGTCGTASAANKSIQPCPAKPYLASSSTGLLPAPCHTAAWFMPPHKSGDEQLTTTSAACTAARRCTKWPRHHRASPVALSSCQYSLSSATSQVTVDYHAQCLHLSPAVLGTHRIMVCSTAAIRVLLIALSHNYLFLPHRSLSVRI